MIAVTRLSGQEIMINADLIEFVETTPDTIITLITGRKILVCQTAEEVRARVLAYRRAAGDRFFHAGVTEAMATAVSGDPGGMQV